MINRDCVQCESALGRTRAEEPRRRWLSRVALGGRIPQVYDHVTVTTCEMVAVVHRRPCFQHLACCSVNSRHIGSKSRFLPTPPAFDVPVGGGSRQNIAIPFGTDKLEWCGYPMVKKFWRYLYSFWHNARIWHSTHTDTAWRHRPRLHIASRGKNQTVQKWTSVQTVSQQKLHVIRHSNNKWLKVTLLALNVQIKNVLEHSHNGV